MNNNKSKYFPQGKDPRVCDYYHEEKKIMVRGIDPEILDDTFDHVQATRI